MPTPDWHPVQEFMIDLSELLAEALESNVCYVGRPYVLFAPNKTGMVQDLMVESYFTMRPYASATTVLLKIDVGDDDYNITLTPGAFDIKEAVPQFLGHIKEAAHLVSQRRSAQRAGSL